MKQGGHCLYKATGMRFRTTIVAVENQYVLHIVIVCLWPLVSIKQCACAILSSVACPVLNCFSTLSQKTARFSEKVCWARNVCF